LYHWRNIWRDRTIVEPQQGRNDHFRIGRVYGDYWKCDVQLVGSVRTSKHAGVVLSEDFSE
jgi:hypothetical protein